MKICDRCGHRNYGVTMSGKKKRICEACERPMSERGQNRPRLGQKQMNSGGYRVPKMRDSDDL